LSQTTILKSKTSQHYSSILGLRHLNSKRTLSGQHILIGTVADNIKSLTALFVSKYKQVRDVCMCKIFGCEGVRLQKHSRVKAFDCKSIRLWRCSTAKIFDCEGVRFYSRKIPLTFSSSGL